MNGELTLNSCVRCRTFRQIGLWPPHHHTLISGVYKNKKALELGHPVLASLHRSGSGHGEEGGQFLRPI